MPPLLRLTGQTLSERPNGRFRSAIPLRIGPIEHSANSLADSPRRLRLRQPNRRKHISNRRAFNIRNKHLSNFRKSVSLERVHPLLLVLAILPAGLVLLVNELGCGLEGWDLFTLLLAFDDNVDPIFHVTPDTPGSFTSLGEAHFCQRTKANIAPLSICLNTHNPASATRTKKLEDQTFAIGVSARLA